MNKSLSDGLNNINYNRLNSVNYFLDDTKYILNHYCSRLKNDIIGYISNMYIIEPGISKEIYDSIKLDFVINTSYETEDRVCLAIGVTFNDVETIANFRRLSCILYHLYTDNKYDKNLETYFLLTFVYRLATHFGLKKIQIN
jgi:hypothetical protein